MARRTNKIPIKDQTRIKMTKAEKYDDVLSSLDSLKVKQHKVIPETPTVVPTTKIIIGVVVITIISLGILSLGNVPRVTDQNTLTGNMIDSEGINFAFKRLDGTESHLADYKGSPVFLDLFATWCKPCETQIIELATLKSVYPYIRILSISIDDTDTVEMLEQFKTDNGITWIVGRDYTLKGAQNFKVTSIPTLAFFNSNGVLKKIEIGIHYYEELASWLDED
ncbi:MAG: TlpA family protein disulfide reductase [Candidatus Hodarchaeales archaeon]|jgi:thiol-disulfide isomerase/thioredoxin